MELLCTNVGSKIFKQVSDSKILLYGTCVQQEYPEIFSEFSKNKICLAVCLEQFHANNAVEKLASILRYNSDKIKELTVLTIDGSPHCIQLHFAAEDAKRITGSNVDINILSLKREKCLKRLLIKSRKKGIFICDFCAV